MIFGELVINEIMKYPEFYEMDLSEYKESNKKNVFYEKVAAALNVTCKKEITCKLPIHNSIQVKIIDIY